MVTKMYKLARPLLKGVQVEISENKPMIITQEFHTIKRKYVERKQPVPNRMVNDMLSGLPSFRGEIVIGKPTDPDCFEITKLFLETENLVHLFVMWVYDLRTTFPFSLDKRLDYAQGFVNTCGPNVQYVDHTLIQSDKELEAYKKVVIDEDKFTGVVLREPYGTFGTEDETIVAETAKASAS